MELNKLVLQREFKKIVTNNVFWTEGKNTTTTEQNIIQKMSCQIRELNPRPLAPQADALRLDHRVN